MKLIRQLGRVIFTLGAKSGDNKVSITVKPFKILIVDASTYVVDELCRLRIVITLLPVHPKTRASS